MDSLITRSSVSIESTDSEEQLIKDNLKNLGRSADSRTVVYKSLDLEGHSLCSIAALKRYRYIETLNLSYNNIKDLEPLSELKYLQYLNVSHNNVPELLSFQPPVALQIADFSHNQLEEMNDLSEHYALKELSLSNNNIHQIFGVAGLRQLTHLNLANNQITRIVNLDELPLKYLNLSGNMISVIDNLETLETLQVLDLSNNQISSLKGLEGHPFLHSLDLHGNQVSDLSEVQYLLDLKILRTLDLTHNPIQNVSQYRAFFVFSLHWITTLDREDISPFDKVLAKNTFDPSMDLMAARRHMFHVTKSLQQPVRLKFSSLTHPNEPYPMLILCGPLGTGKGYMARRLVEDFPTYFGQGLSHTTRPKREGERDGKEYYFISNNTFAAAEDAGDFMQSLERFGYRYGLSVAAVEMVAQHGLACVVHLSIEGALEMKSTYFEPRYVLALPISQQDADFVSDSSHLNRLKRRGCFSEEEITHALEEAEVCKTINQQRPGFFDAVINCDSLDVGYKTLRDLVMEYAGITPNSLVQSTDSIAPSDKEGHSMAHTSADYEAMPMSAVVSGTSSTKTGTLAATEEDSTVVSSVVQETSSGGVVGGLPGTETLDLQSPLLLQNIKQVAKTWSRPSTSLSQYSGTNQSKSRIKSEPLRHSGSRSLKKALEAVQTNAIKRAQITQLSHRSESVVSMASVNSPNDMHQLEEVQLVENEETASETTSIGSGASFSRISSTSGISPSQSPLSA